MSTSESIGIMAITASLAAMISSPFKQCMTDVDALPQKLDTPPSEAATPAMEAVRKLFAEYENSPTPDSEEEDEEEIGQVDKADEQKRTERLRGLALDLHQLWCAGPKVIAKATEIIGDAARDVCWRLPIGNSGCLDAFIMMVLSSAESHVDTLLMMQVLRVIGNSCADTKENRARVVSQGALKPIVQLLKDKRLAKYAAPVILNVCYDYEPGPKQASESGLTEVLIGISQENWFMDIKNMLILTLKLLELVADIPGEEVRAPDNTVEQLLQLILAREDKPTEEEFTLALQLLNGRLKHERFRQRSLTEETVMFLLRLYAVAGSFEGNEAVEKQRVELLTALSDIADLEGFDEVCKPESMVELTLTAWLSGPQPDLQTCSAIMLGNVARNDEACIYFMDKAAVGGPLIRIISYSTNTPALHAALGYLKNLAIPAENKFKIGESNVMNFLPRLWSMDSLPQIQYMAVSLTRILLTGNSPNVYRLLAPLSQDLASPASDKSKLSLLLSLFSKSDNEPVQMEVARLICVVCRVKASEQSKSPEAALLRGEFFKRHADMAKPLSFMVRQKKWAAIRSEAWFILALLARADQSVDITADILSDAEIFNSLMEVLTGKKMLDDVKKEVAAITPTSQTAELLGEMMVSTEDAHSGTELAPVEVRPKMKPADMKRIDRENAFILVTEVLKRKGAEMDEMRRTAFEQLLKEAAVHLKQT